MAPRSLKPPARRHRRAARRVRSYVLDLLSSTPAPSRAPSLTPVFVPRPRRPLEALNASEVPLLERVLTGLRNLPEVA